MNKIFVVTIFHAALYTPEASHPNSHSAPGALEYQEAQISLHILGVCDPRLENYHSASFFYYLFNT